ncbi:MAG: hypothetical protein N3F07_03485 [Candidatus Micrarchaeota archaeon]|nr:hypothetical protein [Candidatus Micrarchaeota archaeon]
MPIREIIRKKAEFLSKQANALSAKIKIIPKSSYSLGEPIDLDIELALRSPIEARGFEAKLVCIETRREKIVREMDTYDRMQERDLGVPYSTHLHTSTRTIEKEIYSQKLQLGKKGRYESGIYHARFEPPKSSPATSHAWHDSRKIVWKVLVKLDIPHAPDAYAQKEIVIA